MQKKKNSLQNCTKKVFLCIEIVDDRCYYNKLKEVIKMNTNSKGIVIAGNIIADIVKTVDCYPKVGMLANVSSVSRAVGGCVSNTAIDLKKIDPSLPVSAVGKIGKDDAGEFLMAQFDKYGVEREGVTVSETQPTSFSDVMSQPSGERTFFHARGSNAEFSPADIDIEGLTCDIFHIGYILLLDAMDAFDAEYGTVMARLLSQIQAKGIKTSVDVVSDSGADYKAKILPSLKYSNYAIMNEIESTMLSDLEPYDQNGRIITENIRKTMELMADAGVKDKIVIHCKEAGFCYDVATKKFTCVASLNVPKSEIKGSVGAGDAFCAGALYGIYNGMSDEEMLKFASASAACNLFAENSIDGLREKAEIEKIAEIYGRKEIELC